MMQPKPIDGAIHKRPLGIEEQLGRGDEHDHRVAEEDIVYRRAVGAATTRDLCQRVSSFMLSWLDASAKHRKPRGWMAERARSLAALSPSPEDWYFAGRTRCDATEVEAALQGCIRGNGDATIRECFFLLNNFFTQRLFPDLLGAPDRVFEGILGGAIHDRETARRLREFRTENSERHDDIDEGDPKPLRPDRLKEVMTKSDTNFARIKRAQKTDRKIAATALDSLEQEYLQGLCRYYRSSPCNHVRRGDCITALRAMLGQEYDTSALEGELHPYAWSREPLDRLDIPLSCRENVFKNHINPDWVPYIRGDYANALAEPGRSEWVDEARNRGLPLRAGPSGTAHRLLFGLTLLGHEGKVARFAVAGFLGQIRAHSCHEILFASDGIGDCTYDPSCYTWTTADEIVNNLFRMTT